MKIRSRSISHVPILMASLALGFVMLACNMPYLAGQGDQVERELAAELGQSFGPAVTDVRLEGASLALAYTPPLLQAQETSAANLVRLMEIGAVKAARVELVRVEVVQAGVPVLAVSGSAKDARLLADGRLTMEAFLSGLAYADLRPVELALQQELARLGVRVRAVRYQNGILELYFWQPEIDSTQALVQSWLPIWNLAAQAAPEAGQVILHVGLLGQPDLRVTAPMELVQNFQAGGLSPAEFLLGLDLQDE